VRKFPVALLELDEADPEFVHVDQRGRSPKFCIEQLDGDRCYFVLKSDAETFIAFHGLAAVSDHEMEKLRRTDGHL